MESYNLSELSVFVGACLASCSALMAVIFRSKCTHVKMGCIECRRPEAAILKDIPGSRKPQPDAQPEPEP